MPEEPVIACSLSPGEQAERLDAVARLSKKALFGAEQTSEGLRLHFSAGPGVEDELKQLIKAESECCPFLEFQLKPRQDELVLQVDGPEQAQPVIHDLFGLTPPTVLES